MKKNAEKYRTIEKLPPTAKTVKNYADSIPITTSHVYKLFKQGKLEIVVYQGVNFVIQPKPH